MTRGEGGRLLLPSAGLPPAVLPSVSLAHACVVAEPPKATRCHRSASDEFVASIIRSDCYRLERQLPGGVRTR